jgi:hypothetical protein
MRPSPMPDQRGVELGVLRGNRQRFGARPHAPGGRERHCHSDGKQITTMTARLVYIPKRWQSMAANDSVA